MCRLSIVTNSLLKDWQNVLCCHTAGSGNHWDPAISIDDDQIVVFLEFSIIHRDLLEGSISDCSNVRSPRLGRRVGNTFFHKN